MRFGVYLPTFAWRNPRLDQAARVKQFARKAEALGFDAPDSLAPVGGTLRAGGRTGLGSARVREALGMKLSERGRRTDEIIAALRRLERVATDIVGRFPREA